LSFWSCRGKYAQPVLVFVRYEEFRDEPDVGIHAIAENGAQVDLFWIEKSPASC